jgi:hypothetical protein
MEPPRKWKDDGMTIVVGSVPAWNSSGVLPPVHPAETGSGLNRSPYPVALPDFVDFFASSPERKRILHGLLRFRAELHKLGIVQGFQWLDGSFLENIEALEQRAPRDMDVVTFFYLPDGMDEEALASRAGLLLDSEAVKREYVIDGYVSLLGGPTDASQISTISYWYSLWSHRRDGLWKGFVQVDLDPAQDAAATLILNMNGGASHE